MQTHRFWSAMFPSAEASCFEKHKTYQPHTNRYYHISAEMLPYERRGNEDGKTFFQFGVKISDTDFKRHTWEMEVDSLFFVCLVNHY